MRAGYQLWVGAVEEALGSVLWFEESKVRGHLVLQGGLGLVLLERRQSYLHGYCVETGAGEGDTVFPLGQPFPKWGAPGDVQDNSAGCGKKILQFLFIV